MLCTVALRALALASLVLLGACAFQDREVALTYVPAAGGALPAGRTYEVTLAEFTDTRANPAFVGKVLNGYGMHTADVLATNSVALWVTDALRLELERAGFTVVPADAAPPDVFAISGEVVQVSSDAYFKYKANIVLQTKVVREDEILILENFHNRADGDVNAFASGAGYEEVLQEALARTISEIIAALAQAAAAAEAADPPEISSRGDDRNDRLMRIDEGA